MVGAAACGGCALGLLCEQADKAHAQLARHNILTNVNGFMIGAPKVLYI